MDVESTRKLLEKTKRGLDDRVVIVEGKRDERALRESGFAPTAPIVKAGGKNAGETAKHAVEARKREKQEIAVLTDYDGEGERRAAEINEALLALGVAPDSALRRNFRRLLGVNCVEDAPTALERLEERLAPEGKGKRRTNRSAIKK